VTLLVAIHGVAISGSNKRALGKALMVFSRLWRRLSVNVFTIRVDIPPIRLEIPALDRIADLWEAKQQAELDAITSKVGKASETLKQSETALKAVVNQQKV